MRVSPAMALVIAGVAVVGCGTVRENRFNEAPIDPVDRKIVYRAPASDERTSSRHDVDVVHVQPGYRVVPVTRSDGYYYYRS
jgi:hypothetical protein